MRVVLVGRVVDAVATWDGRVPSETKAVDVGEGVRTPRIRCGRLNAREVVHVDCVGLPSQ